MRQLDLRPEFEAADRQREAKHEIIDSSPADPRVKSLLHMLCDWPRPSIDERGNWLIKVGVLKMASRLGRTRNTVRSYLQLALGTPYLSVLDASDHDERTYIIHWRSILDRETTKRDAISTVERESDLRDANSTVDDDSRGSIARQGGGQSSIPRGSIRQSEEVNLTSSGGQLTPVKSPQTPLRSENVFKFNTKRSSNVEGGQSRRDVVPLPPGTWYAWKEAIKARDLRKSEHVEELYRIAIQLKIMNEFELGRQRVFEQAHLQTRMNLSGEAISPSGLFASNVANKRWICLPVDENAARESIRMMRSQPSAPRVSTGLREDARKLAAEEQIRRIKDKARTREQLEEEFGPRLDAMSNEELSEIVGEGIMQLIEKHGRNFLLIRDELLTAVSKTLSPTG